MPGENKEKSSPAGKDTAGSVTNALLEKAVSALEESRKREQYLAKRMARMEQFITRFKVKDVPPKDDTKLESDTDHETVGDGNEEDNKPSPDASTKPAKSTTDTAGAFTKADVDKAVSAAVEKALAEAVPKIVEKIRTPIPYGFEDNEMNRALFGGNIPLFVQKAIDEDRKNCGGAYSTEESFGYRTGAGNDSAKRATLKWLHKAFNGSEN